MASAHDLRVLSPVFCDGNAISGCVAELSEHAQGKDMRVECWVPGALPRARRDFMRSPLPHLVTRGVYKLGLERWLLARLERDYRAAMVPDDVAWLWPGVSVPTFEWLVTHGHKVVLERVNSCQVTSKRILDEAYEELGLPVTHLVTEEKVAIEQRKLQLADWVFVPSPWTRKTYLDAGVPESKLIDTSYGWDPQSFVVPQREASATPTPTFLFVGSGDVRKGLPWLLRAWAKAEVDGRLVVTGTLAPEIETLCREHLDRDDVMHIPFTDDLVPLYASADAFVLPSLEEGSPLVMYLAMAAGLPCLLSPAAASGVVRHDVEGLVHDPRSEDGWIASLRLLARDARLRHRFGTAAAERVQEFTWEKVAGRRREALEARLTPAKRTPSSEPALTT